MAEVAREGFDLDLAFGEARESAFVEALQDCHVECKSDQKARVTGRVAIEYEQRGRPSGISTTSARFYAIEVEDDQWIVIRTSLLKALTRAAIADNRSALVGDGSRYRCAFVMIEDLLRRFRAA